MSRLPRLLPLATLAWILLPGRADATPSEAAALGGLDQYAPGELDTFQYFASDLNLFANPALAHRYRDQVQANLGFSGPGPEEGVGVDPRALGLFAVGDSLTLGFALNRDPAEYGEDAAIGDVLGVLAPGAPTLRDAGATYADPLALAGVAPGSAVTPLQPPLDLFASWSLGATALGLDLYAALGQDGSTSESATNPGDPDTEWTRSTTTSRTSWLEATAGVDVDTDAAEVEGWLRFTSISSYADALASGPADRGALDARDETVLDRTVGLQGTNRVGGGVRATVPLSDTVDLVPAVLVDVAGGSTFGTDRLANDVDEPDESAIVQAEDDTLHASALSVRAGAGIEARPVEGLRIVSTVGLDLQRVGLDTDDHAEKLEVEGSSRTAIASAATTLRLPVVSLGAEYAVSEKFAIRGGARATVLLDRVSVTSTTSVGIEDDGWKLGEVGTTRSSSDGGDTPPLTAGIGPSVRLGGLTLDGVIGGAMVGQGDDLFSRVDAVFTW